MRFKRLFHVLPLRLRSLFRRSRVEHELDEEFRYHLERQIEHNVVRGMSAGETPKNSGGATPIIVKGMPVIVIEDPIAAVLRENVFSQYPSLITVTGDAASEIWIPISMLPRVNPGSTSLGDSGTLWLNAMARLKSGVSEEQAQANLDVVLPVVRQKMGIKEKADHRIELVPAARGLSPLREQYSLALRILMVLVGIVLVIACANLANLLISRGTVRRREMAIRLAIGAARTRLVRQLLTESLLLATLGGLLGLVFALWSNQFLVAFVANSLRVPVDPRMLAFSAILSLLTAVLFGVVPALRSTRLNLIPVLKESARGVAGTRQRLGRSLVVLQVALSMILLTGAGLFLRTLHNLKTHDLGFDPKNVLLMTIEPALAGYTGPALLSLYQEVLDRVQAIPGVRSASISRFGMIGGGFASRRVSVPGYAPPQDVREQAANTSIGPGNGVANNVIGPRFFETAGIPLLAGRDFSAGDTASAPRVAIVNSKFARTYFGSDNPIGRTFGFQPPPAPQFEIVGVVQDSKFFQLRNDRPPTVFLPFLQASGAGPGLVRMFLAVRTVGDPASLTGAVQHELHSIAKEMPSHNVRTQDEQLDATVVRERLLATLSGFFSVLALLLASVGLYGVMSYSVAQRTNEIGVRVALGARRSDVIRLVLGESLWMVFIGVAVGLGASVALTRFIATLLFGLAPNDPTTIAVAIAFMTSVAAVAGYLPARRASRVDPMVALRHE